MGEGNMCELRTAKPTVFICYSREDNQGKARESRWLDLVTKHLRVYALQDRLDIWSDERIATGADWLQEIESALESASAAILLVSVDFLISKFIREREVPRLLQRRPGEQAAPTAREDGESAGGMRRASQKAEES